MGESFHYVSYGQEVIFAPGALSQLGEAAQRHGWQRLMLCTGQALRANGQVAELEAALGPTLVSVYDRVQPHVPDTLVEEAIRLATEKEVDAVIGLGGGSPIGMAKAVAVGLRKGHPAGLHPPVAVVAIPTTYAGSEMTAVFGVTRTRETPPRKVTVSDPRAAPQLVIYDPRLTLDLPAEMTASTGINALAHCFEALYSISRNPLSSAAALSGIRHIHSALPRCYANGSDLDACAEMLLGAHLAGWSLSSVAMGLHHGLCHVLGGSAGVPHGIANSILLAHVLRFNAEATATQLLPAVEAWGISLDGHGPAEGVMQIAQSIAEFTLQMELLQHLRDAGVKESNLPLLAHLAAQNRTVQNNPRPVNAQQIEDLLRAAW